MDEYEASTSCSSGGSDDPTDETSGNQLGRVELEPSQGLDGDDIAPNDRTNTPPFLSVSGFSLPLAILDASSPVSQFSIPGSPQGISALERHTLRLHLTTAIINEALELLEDDDE